MLAEKLNQLLAQTELSVSEQQKQQLLGFVQLLDKWNKAYNLTSVRDPQEMLVKHILDSVVVSPHLQGARFIDVGTGPGLPGIPLAIMNPDKHFVLLDSLGKRIRFIRQVQHELGLTNIIAVQSRVEEYQPEQPLDGVLSRAFASLNDMLHWCQHLPAAEHGLFYALKGQHPQHETEELPTWCDVKSVIPLCVPELNAERHLVLIGKKETQ